MLADGGGLRPPQPPRFFEKKNHMAGFCRPVSSTETLKTHGGRTTPLQDRQTTIIANGGAAPLNPPTLFAKNNVVAFRASL